VSSDPGRNQATTIGLAIASVILAIVATVLILDYTANGVNQSPIAGDPPAYDAIATAILDGEIPYINTTVEHFPGALVPMVLVEGLSEITNVSFATLWPFIMGAIFVLSVGLANGIPAGTGTARRYLLLSLPLLPLVLFRIEPWLMVWVVASISLAARSAWKESSLTTVAASLIKGWPIILLALPYRFGRRRVAVIAGLATVLVLVGVSLLPGFREGRAFEGIHTETITGNLMLVLRGVTGRSPGLIGTAGATYVAAGTWAVILNVLVGLPFILLGFRALTDRRAFGSLTSAIGLVVVGIILSSPLFSSQFLFWLVPFMLFLMVGRQLLYVAASTLTLATVIWWEPAELWWSFLVMGRNVFFIVLAILWAVSVQRDRAGTGISQNVA
jgi:hypothetical protein